MIQIFNTYFNYVVNISCLEMTALYLYAGNHDECRGWKSIGWISNLLNKNTKRAVEKTPILIGLTGGIASGKSTVIPYIRYQGYPVIDADKLGHKVLELGNPGYSKVVEKFG